MEKMRTSNILWAVAAFLALMFAFVLDVRADVQEQHEQMIYPVVRVTQGRGGGSGTVVYSKALDDVFSTYVLTNHHVIADAISVSKEWDTDLQREVKKEKRSLVYVEIFQYKNISIPIGTLKVEASIVIYNKTEDMALLKLSSEKITEHVAKLYPKDGIDNIHVFDKTVAVGCSLLFPPLPTSGEITRQNLYINSLPFNMSSSQIIYGNSGGAMFTADGRLIGIPSLVAIAGWSTPIMHMGLFIPVDRIYKWLEKEHYDFIYDNSRNEKDSLDERKKEIETKKKIGESK